MTVLHHLATLGEDRRYFAEMVEAGFHEVAIRMVADGRADAAAIDSQVLNIELRDHPELAGQVRRIGTIGPSTIQPVVVSRSRLTPAERETIRSALIGLADEPSARPVLDVALVSRFVPMNATGYDDVRAMYARVRGNGLLDASWDVRWQSTTNSVLAHSFAAGEMVALTQQEVGREVGPEGRRQLTEHLCPQCGDTVIDARPADEADERSL